MSGEWDLAVFLQAEAFLAVAASMVDLTDLRKTQDRVGVRATSSSIDPQPLSPSHRTVLRVEGITPLRKSTRPLAGKAMGRL